MGRELMRELIINEGLLVCSPRGWFKVNHYKIGHNSESQIVDYVFTSGCICVR